MSSAKLVPPHPEDVMVICNLTPAIATFSVPFARFGKAKIGGRGTLVKLSSGTLAVFSPVALTEATKRKVAEMGGNVAYIVALDLEHHIFLSDWADAFPAAKIVGPAGLQEKRSKQRDDPMIRDNKIDVSFTRENKRTLRIGEDFDADFDYEFVDGHANRELVFHYKPARALIEADLLFNLPAVEQYSRAPAAERESSSLVDKIFGCVQDPQGDAKWMKRFNWYLLAKDRPSFNDSIKRIRRWDFQTVIPCHGDVLKGNGKDVFEKVFSWSLEAKDGSEM